MPSRYSSARTPAGHAPASFTPPDPQIIQFRAQREPRYHAHTTTPNGDSTGVKIWQRATGSWVTVTGKRREGDLLICLGPPAW
jgi:hypothetical protein